MAPRYFRCQPSRQDISEPSARTTRPRTRQRDRRGDGDPFALTRQGTEGGFLIPVVCLYCEQSSAISQTVILDIYYRL